MPIPTFATGGGTPNQTIAPNLSQLTRGIGHIFEVDFFDDAPTNTVPAVPANPATYPAWSVVDPSGVQVTSGVGTPGAVPGRWNASWFVPPDAALSTQTNKWRIVWNMVTQTSRQLQQTVPFDVVELRTPDTLQDVRAHSYIIYAGQSERMVLRLPRRPDSLTVTGYAATSLSSPVPLDTPAFSGSLAGASIVEVEEQNLFAYVYDTPALTTLGEYQVVWTYRQTITSPSETTVQKLVVPPPVFWSLNPSLRVLIDKLQKKQGSIHAYNDADIYEYFQRGIGILNGITPVTGWDLCTFPFNGATTRFAIVGAALWAMYAQHLLAGELQFSFCLDEESLVRTDRGLVQAKHLIDEVDPDHLAGAALIKKTGDDFLKAMFAESLLRKGKRSAQEIIEISKLDLNPLSLTSLLTTLGLHAYHEKGVTGRWNMAKIWPHLAKTYGLAWLMANQEYPVKRNALHSVMSFSDNKRPLFVWDLGRKPCLTVRTECGLEETATPDHGFLVLDTKTLDVHWRKFIDIKVGDYIAVDATAEADVDWDVSIPEVAIHTPTEKDYGYKLPPTLTPELARVLGFLVAEGTVNDGRRVLFSNTDDVMLAQFEADALVALGGPPHSRPVTKQTGRTSELNGRSFTSNKDLTHLDYSGVLLRRQLAACGLAYEKATEKTIPWCVLQAPLRLAAEFIKAYFDGDGCFGLVDRGDDQAKTEMVIFTSYSHKFRNQLMSLLLRFGILARDNGFDRVTLIGPDVRLYAAKIGFLQKRGDIDLERPLQVGGRTALPIEMFEALRNIKDLIPEVNAKGWWDNPETGEKERVTVRWDHSGKGCTTYTGKENLRRWYEDRKAALQKVGAFDLIRRIEFHLDRDVRWQCVMSITDAGERRVLDPSLPDGSGDVLDHAFTAQGFVNHNSGQSVTLDLDQTSLYSEVAQRMLEELTGDGKGSWPATKVGYLRQVLPVAHVANRMMGRYGSNQYTYKIASGEAGQSLNSAFPGQGVGVGFTLTDVLITYGLV